jgi:hypothetical protein
MGIRFTCPNGHQLHVKSFLAGKRGVCPKCGAATLIPSDSQPQAVAAPATTTSVMAGATPQSSAAVLGDIGSQSVVIATTGNTVAGNSVLDGPIAVVDTPSQLAVSPVHQISADLSPAVSSPATSAPAATPGLVVDPYDAASPAVHYVARRQRNRRNQVTIAVGLLLAVIVLAAVLIWVLQQGTSAATGRQAVTSQDGRSGSAHVVTSTFHHGLTGPAQW